MFKKIKSEIISRFKNTPLWGTTVLVLLFIAEILKIGVIYISYKNLDPRGNVLSHVLGDILIFVIASIIIFINAQIKNKKRRRIGCIILYLLFILFCVDIFTLYFFQARVTISEIIEYTSYGGNGWEMEVFMYVMMIIALSLGMFFLIKAKSKKIIGFIYLILLIGYLSSFRCMKIRDIALDPEKISNIITLNIKAINERFFDSNIETEEIESIVPYDNYIINKIGGGKDYNIILVFAESLSAIDSSNIGGYYSMPKFDKLQKKGITFTNFITNGTTSDGSHIATLLGNIPLINKGKDGVSYGDYKQITPPLATFLNNEGYSTVFISTASLEYMEQKEFLEKVGFSKIIGEEEFKNKRKYTFGAAPDKDLYDKVLNEIDVQTGKYFIGLQTISFHKPYNTPYGKTEKSALKYSDDSLYEFYNELDKRNFFDSGILIIVGDHRSMTPAKKDEYEKFGKNWYTRSVATVIGSGIQEGTINDNLIQHSDFFHSIKKEVGHGIVKLDKTYNNVFSGKSNRNRAITNAKFWENNRYTISFTDKEPFLFRNLSNFQDKNSEVYKYFSAYLNYQFGNEIKEEDSDIILIGHRGAINVSPENTLESFTNAKQQGAKGIEFDVSFTNDHKSIIAHGEELYASSCTKDKVGEHTLEWIKENCRIINGEKYKDLQEMLELVDGLFDYYFLEIKVDNEELGETQAIDAINIVKNLNMQDRVIFISYSDEARKVLEESDGIIYGRDTFNVDDIDRIGNNKSKYVLLPYDKLNSEVIEKIKGINKIPVTYTVNNTGDYQTVKNLGVKIILTDIIDELKEYEKTEKISNL